MSVEKNRARMVRSWWFAGVVMALCAVLGVLQYRWIGEVSLAEHDRLRAGLQTSLHRLSQDFNAEVAAACLALLPESSQVDDADREAAYRARYAQWKESSQHNRLFRRIALVIPQGPDGAHELRSLDLDQGVFATAEWPAGWNALRDRLAARIQGLPLRFGSMAEDHPALIDLPRFTRPGGPGFRPREAEWLLLELDLDYLSAVVFPELLERHLGGRGKLEYQAELVARSNPAAVIYQSDGGARIGENADASVVLFDVPYDQLMRRGPGRGMPPPDRGRWQLSVRHKSGSLETVVEQARRRNLAVTTAILVLMLGAIAALVRYTARAQKLAQLQMDFVAGVSHELRTPLSVMRTAAHNLKSGVVSSAAQVQRYGALIADEAERLTGIVEQVLRFASSKAGHAIGEREPVAVHALIDEALAGAAAAIAESRCETEKRIDAELPPVLADPVALKHALQNLLTNAAKYGSEGGWIGVSAGGRDSAVEIRVADRGPGIPPDELGQIFDPFYRGRRAIEDQIHGTGLGLNLVKRIIEAHGGTVSVHSEPGKGAEFVLRIPAAPAERMDEFADTSRRG